MAKIFCLLVMAGLTTASLPRTLTVGSRAVNTTSLLADILAQLDQPINEAVEAALRHSSSSSSESSESSSALVSQVVGQVSPGVEEAVVGVVTSQQDHQAGLLVSQVTSAVAQIVASQVQSSLLISNSSTSTSTSSISNSAASLTEQVVAAIRPAVVTAAATEIRSQTQSEKIQSELSSRLQPQIQAAVTEILRTTAEESFDRQYQSEVLVSEVLAAVKLRISRLLSQSLDDSQYQAETISSEVLEAVRPTVSSAVWTQLRSLKESVLSRAASQSEVSRYVSQVSEVLQARVRAAVAGAVRSQAENISDLVLTGLRPNILTLISAAITNTKGKGEEKSPDVKISPGLPLEPPAGQRCSGRNYGGRRCCTPENPCQEGEGDCDGPGDGGAHDGHRGCAGGLVCGTNNCLQFGLYYHPKDDCCERPTSRPKPPPAPSAPVAGVWQEPPPGEKCSGRNYQGRRCCTPESPCDVGQGDCDGPADGGAHDGHRGCRAGLVCGSNNCRKFGAYFHEKDDCCEQPSGAGGWGQWGEFGSCSAGCGGGKWERQRYCKGPGCRHSTQSQQRICNTQPCSAPSQSLIEYPAPSAPSYCGNSYQPVCDTRGQTHDNNCEAQAAGAVVQCQGRCPCQQRPACPQETCAAGYSGYGDHCYKFINEALSWSEARARCVAEQSDLASVHSRPENEFLRQLSRGERLWLGGRRARRTRDFTWSDGSAWDWDNWDQGEPNNYFQDEDCLELYTQRAAWNDDHCSLFSSPFVCKQGRVCRGSVDCGDHRAGSCSSCPWDPDSKRNYGAQWCQGDCVWRYGACGPRY